QYFYWVKGVLSGNLGESMRIHVPVLDLILQKLPVTIQLASMAIVIALLIGITAGIVSAGEEKKPQGLRGQWLRPVGHFDAEFLARHHVDLPLFGEAGLAARVGLRSTDRRLARQSRLHDHAGFCPRQCDRRNLDAPYPQRHASGARER